MKNPDTENALTSFNPGQLIVLTTDIVIFSRAMSRGSVGLVLTVDLEAASFPDPLCINCLIFNELIWFKPSELKLA